MSSNALDPTFFDALCLDAAELLGIDRELIVVGRCNGQWIVELGRRGEKYSAGFHSTSPATALSEAVAQWRRA